MCCPGCARACAWTCCASEIPSKPRTRTNQRREKKKKPHDKHERAELTKQAGAFVEPGFKLVMQEKVDKKLIGGFVLEFEDRLVDMSVAKKLEEFNNLVFKLEGDLR